MYTYSRIVGITLGFLLLMPMSAQATRFEANKEYTLGQSEAVLENLYVWSGSANIAGQVHGDLVLGAGNATITGDILDDALLTGGSLTMLGLVGDDVRVVGGDIILGGSVGGDVVAAGGMLHLLPDAEIQGDFIVVGGEVIIDGTVEGDVRVRGGRLVIHGVVLGDVEASLKDEIVIGAGASIGGVLRYSAPNRFNIPAGAQIGGGVEYSEGALLGAKVGAGAGVGAGVGASFLGGALGILAGLLLTFRLLTWLGFGLFIVWVWRRWALQMVQDLHGSFLKSFGQGVLAFIFVPLVLGLLLISFIGTMVGVAGIALYTLLLILSHALSGIFLGAWLSKVLSKKKVLHVTYGWTVIGVLVIQALFFLPFIGWLVSVVISLALLGVLFRSAWHRLHS